MKLEVEELGKLSYQPAWDRQRQVAEEVAAGAPDCLLFVEHPPVLTLGANFHEENLLLSTAEYQERGIDLVRTDRGGDVTYHGPGQLVIYPIFDLNRHGRDLHRWMRQLEETMIVALRVFGIAGSRNPPHTGAWIGDRKVAAIGVKIRRWVSLHGIALNCENSLDPFGLIVPCGIADYGVTSLTAELGRVVTPAEAQPVVEAAFRTVFQFDI